MDDMMTPMEAILSDPSQVWLTSYFGFTPEDWGFFSFTDKSRMEAVVEQSKSGFLVVIYGSKSNQTPKEQRGKVIGIYQCSHRMGVAEEFASAVGMDRKRRNQKSENQWNHGIQAVRAWRVVPESYQDIAEFAPNSYDSNSGTAISRYGIKLTPEDARNILNLDLEECEVFGSLLDGVPKLGSGNDVMDQPTPKLSPSKAGPVSKTPYQTRESEGPKHLYMLELTGPIDHLLDDDTTSKRIVKIGFSKSPKSRCNAFNRSLPECKIKWQILNSTNAEGLEPFETSAHAMAGEDVMKVYLDRHAASLNGEFFLANDDQLGDAWKAAKITAKDFQP